MATQSLYRRYRPRRFSELRGQEHIVRALRNAVINKREGQAYLFSGPRGTGKTTSARILAKVLNCERSVEGEPCCECDSCLAVERGTSFDVHELDAASNNGVDAMRDLIEKASLGTPGRHKVYILDEVHMLSKQAEAALLKTLEEPPPHVVFVLATTDPQKISETIRSRTQHLRFHLLPMDELEAHIRWVIADAGLVVSEAAIQSVLEQGGGSARDTLSALELVASAGGDDVDAVHYGEFVEALIEMDPGRALTATAFAVQQGRDPRGLTEDVVRHLRDCFLSLMAPELVALPEGKAASVAEQAVRLGAGRVVRAMERLGEVLVEMRHAPDPRLLLEVVLVQLTHEAAANDVATLMSRLERLEQAVAAGAVRGAGGGSGPGAASVSAPIDPATGRVQLGGRAQRTSPPAATPSATPTPTPSATPSRPPTPPLELVAPAVSEPAVSEPAVSEPEVSEPEVSEPAVPGLRVVVDQRGVAGAAERAAALWASDVLPSLKPFVRAMYAAAHLVGPRDGVLVLSVANEPTRQRCEQHRRDIETAIAGLVSGEVEVELVVDSSDRHEDPDDGPVKARTTTRTENGIDGRVGPSAASNRGGEASIIELHPGGATAPDEEIDLDDLVDVPPETVVTPIERLAQAFPGSELMDERS